MAGDWIKMRGNLWDDPRVARLCDLTEQTEATIIGGLYWLWATADQHTEDGCMFGLSIRQIDRKTGIPGFGNALVAIGWIVDGPNGVEIVRFDEHNGESAKRRAADAKRKAEVRKVSENSRTNDGQKTDNSGEVAELEEEKEEEEEKESSSSKKIEGTERGTRLPKDWTASAEFISFCETERPDLNPKQMQDKFRDYWTGVSGSKGVKLDWLATWRNFIRSERSPPRAQPQKQSRHTGFEQMNYSEGVTADGSLI